MVRRALLDVSSMMYRAFFALREPGVFTRDGRPIAAVHGYLDMVTKLTVDRSPDEVVHVYDHDWRPVERTDIYPAYKGNRLPDPEDLPPQFVLLRQVLDATGMLQAQTEGWEAEDAIGAFCLDAREDDRIEIVSGDRDLIQVVRDPVVKLLFTVRGTSRTSSASRDPSNVSWPPRRQPVPAERPRAERSPPERRPDSITVASLVPWPDTGAGPLTAPIGGIEGGYRERRCPCVERVHDRQCVRGARHTLPCQLSDVPYRRR